MPPSLLSSSRIVTLVLVFWVFCVSALVFQRGENLNLITILPCLFSTLHSLLPCDGLFFAWYAF